MLWYLLQCIFMFGCAKGDSFKKPLSKEEEKKCLEAFAKGSKEAKDELIERNRRLVAHIANKYATSATERDDFISIGTIGLIHAVETFDMKKNVRLATYASRCITNEIFMHFRSTKKVNQEVFLQDPVGGGGEGNEMTRESQLEDQGMSVEKEVMLQMACESMYQEMALALDDRETTIINLRYGLLEEREHTQKEIGNILGISRAYVSRLEKKALEKIRKRLEP